MNILVRSRVVVISSYYVNIIYFKSVRFKNTSEESPDVPPLVVMVQEDGLHLVLIVLGLVVRRVLG